MMVSGRPAGTLAMFVCAFVFASAVIVAQRLVLPRTPGARERKAQLRLAELRGTPPGVNGTASGLPGAGNGVIGRPAAAHVLMRVATTGIYLVRGVPLELQRAARVRAVSDGTTLHQVLLEGLSEYAAGTWTPQPGNKRSAA